MNAIRLLNKLRKRGISIKFNYYFLPWITWSDEIRKAVKKDEASTYLNLKKYGFLGLTLHVIGALLQIIS